MAMLLSPTYLPDAVTGRLTPRASIHRSETVRIFHSYEDVSYRRLCNGSKVIPWVWLREVLWLRADSRKRRSRCLNFSTESNGADSQVAA